MKDFSHKMCKRKNKVELQDSSTVEDEVCKRNMSVKAISMNESYVMYTIAEQYSTDEICADDEAGQEKSDSDIDKDCLQKQENEYCFEKEWIMERKCMLYTLLYVRALNRRLRGDIFTVNKLKNGQFGITRTDPRFRLNVSLVEKPGMEG